MTESKASWFLGAYSMSAVAEVLSILFEVDLVHQIAKPLLMVSLLLYFWAASTDIPKWKGWVFGALSFSWLGDVLLMYDALFVLGLGSFLIAHLFYIVTFYQTGAQSGILKTFDVIKFSVVGIGLMWVLYPGLGVMLFPVLLYAIALLTMATMAQKRRGATTFLSFSQVSIGAVLFVVSDALIAVNKFAYEIPFEGLAVMITYIAAQYLIIQGLINHVSPD